MVQVGWVVDCREVGVGLGWLVGLMCELSRGLWADDFGDFTED